MGGSTRLPLVRKLLEEHFPQCAVDARLQPDLAVSWGATLQAAIIQGTAPEVILVDVCSHSLGIGVAENPDMVAENFKKVAKKYGIMQPFHDDYLKMFLGSSFEDFQRDLHGILKVAPIINRNSQLPACKSEFFHTIYANQPAVHVIIVQGEGATVAENRLIGSFLFELQQPVEEGARCEIQLTYDVNGMVQVMARQLGTPNAARAQFDSRSGTVKGWFPLGASAQSAQEMQQTYGHESGSSPLGLGTLVAEGIAPVLERGLGGLHGVKGDSSRDAPISPASPNVEGGAPVSNALLVRGKRALMTLLPSDQRRNALEDLLGAYAQQLADAMDLDNEDVLVISEQKIQNILHELGR